MIKIQELNPLKDDYRWLTFDFDIRKSSYMVALHRKKGSINGEHYHKWNIKSKSPEVFYLAEGEVKIIAIDMYTLQRKEYIVKKYSTIEIPPMIYHEVHALTDIILIEFNIEREDFKSDTVKRPFHNNNLQ